MPDFKRIYPFDSGSACALLTINTVSKNSYYHWLKSKDLEVVKTPIILLKEKIKIIFETSN